MRLHIALTPVALLACLAVAGCHDTPADSTHIGNNVLPNYAGTHFNPAVNDDGSKVGTDDPAIHPTGTSEVNGGGMRMDRPANDINAGNPNGTTVGGGTSSENSGSGSPSGATGTSVGR